MNTKLPLTPDEEVARKATEVEREEALRRIRVISRTHRIELGPMTWTREDLYGRKL